MFDFDGSTSEISVQRRINSNCGFMDTNTGFNSTAQMNASNSLLVINSQEPNKRKIEISSSSPLRSENNMNSYIRIDDNYKSSQPAIREIKSNLNQMKSRFECYDQIQDDLSNILNKEKEEKMMRLEKEYTGLKKKFELEIEKRTALELNFANFKMSKQIEICNLRNDLEKKYKSELSRITKTFDNRIKDECKILQEKIKDLELKNIELNRENLIWKQNEKKELDEYQSWYLKELNELQQSYLSFKVEAQKEFDRLLGLKSQEESNATYYENLYLNTKTELESMQAYISDIERVYQIKLDNVKQLVKANEMLKIELDTSRREIDYLRNEIIAYGNSEKKLQKLAFENDFINRKMIDYGVKFELPQRLTNEKSMSVVSSATSPKNQNREIRPLFKETNNTNDQSRPDSKFDKSITSSKSFIVPGSSIGLININNDMNKPTMNSYRKIQKVKIVCPESVYTSENKKETFDLNSTEASHWAKSSCKKSEKDSNSATENEITSSSNHQMISKNESYKSAVQSINRHASVDRVMNSGSNIREKVNKKISNRTNTYTPELQENPLYYNQNCTPTLNSKPENRGILKSVYSKSPIKKTTITSQQSLNHSGFNSESTSKPKLMNSKQIQLSKLNNQSRENKSVNS